jgi:alanine racemase
MRPTIAEIDLAAIRHNMKEIRQAVGPTANVVAVVKADAYGHGAVKISKACLASGANCLAVAIPEEGAELRAAGITVPIFVLGLTLPDQVNLLLENDLIAPVCNQDNLQAIDTAARQLGRIGQVMIKTDTGMGRIGINPAEMEKLLTSLPDFSNIRLVGTFTHLASADEQDKTYANNQIQLFKKTVGNMSRAYPLHYISAANSATIIDLPAGHFNTVRPGIIIYGLPPSGEMHNALDLQPAMQFKTKIVFIKHIEAGHAISYGCTYVTKQDTYLATLPVGYADGYNRGLSNKGFVLIGGQRRPVVGRVCMDQIIVDLGPNLNAAVGDEAILFGRQDGAEITATEIADLLGTINYEIVCAVGSRVPRVYLNE